MAACAEQSVADTQQAPCYARCCMIVAAAQAQEEVASNGSSAEIWHDSDTMQYLQHGSFPAATSHEQRCRISKRLKCYRWQDNKLQRTMPDGTVKQVPPPADKEKLIQQFHEQCGHFGVRRTTALLQSSYWWHGLQADVAAQVNKCQLCHRTRTSFNAVQPTLQPLPIMGMHYSKWIELVPLPSKSAPQMAAAFAHAVLGRFGSCAEVLTDQGSEWKAEFDQLLMQALIDHRMTSAHHPQADGLAERAVQTVKRALRKLCEQGQSVTEWDTMLPWLALGYRCSPQQSTGFSPYELLFARKPTIPPAVVERLSTPINFDDKEAAAAADLAQRMAAVQRSAAMAGDNLLIAQHRDTLRYERICSNGYQPRVRRFEAGDYVYLQQTTHSTLQIPTRPIILRVLQVRPSGVPLLQGRDAKPITRHVSRCAPCHLPNIDGTVDYTLAEVEEAVACERCGSPDQADVMLMCDGCNSGWHMHCLQPPLEELPEAEVWLCAACLAAGRTEADVLKQRPLTAQQAAEEAAWPVLFPDAAMRSRDEAAHALHGRLLQKQKQTGPGRRSQSVWGRVHFRGAHSMPQYFLVLFEDGTKELHSKTTLEKQYRLKPVRAKLPKRVVIPEAPAASAGPDPKP